MATECAPLAHVTRSAVTCLAIVMLASGCAGHPRPGREAAPLKGAVQIGVAYGVTVDCPIPFELGEMWWDWADGGANWPPEDLPPFPLDIWANRSSPYPVSGIVTLSSATSAVFRADVDGSVHALTGSQDNPAPGLACL